MSNTPKVQALKDRALALWHDLQEEELDYNEFLEIQEYIIDLFCSIN